MSSLLLWVRVAAFVWVGALVMVLLAEIRPLQRLIPDWLRTLSRVAVLWVALTVASMGSWLVMLFEAGRVEELLAGTIEGEPLDDTVGFTLTVLVVLPLVMAGVTLLLSDRVNRWVNVVGGLAFGLLGVYAGGSALLTGELHWHIWPTVLAMALAFLIVGLGVVGMRQPSSSPT